MAWRFNDYPGNIAGSVFSKGGDVIVPPSGHIFIAITTLAATTFSNTTGLVAEDAAGDAAAGSETYSEGSGGEEVVVGDAFPAGIDIFGQYTKINVNSGSIIAYYAKK